MDVVIYHWYFFLCCRIKNELKVFDEKDLSPETVKKISQKLVVDEQEVINMNQRIGGDYSLNAPRTIESSDGDWQEVLVDDKSINQETYVVEKEELEKRKSMLGSALSLLSDASSIPALSLAALLSLWTASCILSPFTG